MQPKSLTRFPENIHFETNQFTVSGLSSGAFMAHQLHVIHSDRIIGAGIIAGGPYRCAKEHFWGSYFDTSGLYAAASVCTRSSASIYNSSKPSYKFSVKEAKRNAQNRAIDATSNLKQSRVWLFTGGNDNKVPRATMDALQGFYHELMDDDRISYIHHKKAGHAMPTDSFGNRCTSSRSPYINNCDYDAAGIMLEFIEGPLKPRKKAQESSLFTFDQAPYFNTEDDSISLGHDGLVYIPKACRDGEPCRLHVAFHGCKQNYTTIEDTFARNAGYNEWAEANNIVVLYPQTGNWKNNDPIDLQRNPKGCWDWWGYTGEDFSNKKGPQIKAVMAMVDALVMQPVLEGQL